MALGQLAVPAVARKRVRAQELGVRILLAKGKLRVGDLSHETKAAIISSHHANDDDAHDGDEGAPLPMTKDRFLLEQTKAGLRTLRAELEALRGADDGHRTTGQAFVVFQLETQRNALINLFEPSMSGAC